MLSILTFDLFQFLILPSAPPLEASPTPLLLDYIPKPLGPL